MKKKKKEIKTVFAGIALENIGRGDIVKIERNHKKGMTTVVLARSDIDFFDIKPNQIKK